MPCPNSPWTEDTKYDHAQASVATNQTPQSLEVTCFTIITSAKRDTFSRKMEPVFVRTVNGPKSQDVSVSASLSTTTVGIQIMLDVIPERGHLTGGETVRVNLDETAILSCNVEGEPVTDFRWRKIEDPEGKRKLENGPMDETIRIMTLNLTSVTHGDNGTYECSAKDYKRKISARTFLVVTEVPEVRIESATPDGAGNVYLNWTVHDGNEPLTALSIQYKDKDTSQWTDNPEEISVNDTSYVVKGLETKTAYDFRITATNSVGESQPAVADATTSGTAGINGMGACIAVWSGVILALLSYS